jgi:hypothetical protein
MCPNLAIQDLTLTVSDWIQLLSTLVLVASILVSYYFSAKTLKQIKDQIMVSVFMEYTQRYAAIIRELPDSVSSPDCSVLKTLSKQEKDKVMGLMRAYFDLCAEEFYLYEMGKIDFKTWKQWERGIIYTVRLPTFREAWNIIKIEGYDEKFLKYIQEILSAS